MEIEDLIYKFLLGELTPEEEPRFKQMIEEEPKYKELLERLKDSSYLRGKYEAYKKANVEAAWKRNVKSRRSRASKRLRVFRYAASAACLVLAISISYWMMQENGREGTNPVLTNASPSSTETTNANVRVIIEGNSYEVKDSTDLEHYQRELLEQAKDTIPEIKNLQIMVSAGHTFQFTLPDGSAVRMNSGSRLKYPSRFSGDTREVELLGEAYFDVQKDEQHPFIVACAGYKVQVLGTSFNIKDYAEDGQSYITLVSGKVRVMSPETSDCVLQPNQQAVVDRADGMFEVRNVNVNEYLSWLKDRFYFKETSLEEIARELSRWYGVRIVVENHTPKTFTGGFAKYKDVNKILKLLSETTRIDFVTRDSCIVVK